MHKKVRSQMINFLNVTTRKKRQREMRGPSFDLRIYYNDYIQMVAIRQSTIFELSNFKSL